MKEQHKKAFDFASDVTKQLITLSTAIITITITFSKDIVDFSDTSAKNYLLWAWVLYIFTVIWGILTLMALTGSLQPMKRQSKKSGADKTNNSKDSDSKEDAQVIEQECSINSPNIRTFSILQIVCFIVALSLTIAYGYKSLSGKENTINETKCVKQASGKELKIIQEIKYSVIPDSTIDTLTVK